MEPNHGRPHRHLPVAPGAPPDRGAGLALSGQETAPGFQRVTALVAVAVIGYTVWRFHGLIPSAVAIVAFRLADPSSPPPAALLERPADALLLATLGIGIAAASRQGRPGNFSWLLLVVAGAATTGFGWYRMDAWPTDDPVAHDRLRHVALARPPSRPVGSPLSLSVDRPAHFAVAVRLPAAGWWLRTDTGGHGCWTG